MSKNKNAVKRTGKNVPIGIEKALKRVKDAVDVYNALYGDDPNYQLIVLTRADQMVEGTKAIAYTQQMEQDISCMALHSAFGIGESRQKIYHDEVAKISNEFKGLRDATKDDDAELWEYQDKFEKRLQAAVGKYYVPRKQRYFSEIYFKGKKVDELNVDEVENAMAIMRGEQIRHEAE